MKTKLISYSLISTLCMSGTSASAQSSQKQRINELEATLECIEKSGKTDTFLLLSLARAYFVSGQFKKGRQTYGKLITVYEKQRAGFGELYVPNIYGLWANDENKHAQDFLAAERLMKKQLAIADKLLHSSPIRIKAHRNMVEFYIACSKEDEARREAVVLAELIGTSDPEMLLPLYNFQACARG